MIYTRVRYCFMTAILGFPVFGCSAASDGAQDDSSRDGQDLDVGQSAPAELEEPRLTAGSPEAASEGAAFGTLEGDEVIARVDVSGTHSIEFWQTSSGRVTIVEAYNVDENDGPKLMGLEARPGSYVELYERLSGANAQADAVERLRAADLVRTEYEGPFRVQGDLDREAPAISEAAATARGTPGDYTGAFRKSVQGDKDWFLNQRIIRTRNFVGEDLDRSYDATLTPALGTWTLTWNFRGYEEANIALFNADFSSNATLYTTGVDCGFLELGLCDTLIRRNLTVQPRWMLQVYNQSDDGFNTKASGKAFGVHYLFWD